MAPPLGRTGAGDAALARGFAVVTTDTGHKGEVFDATFMGEQQASLDFAYQAVGRVAVLARQIVAQHYGRPAEHAYFAGCSTGGREGMLMAQRYPTYFDGIVVGAPAMRTSFSGIGDEWVATMLNGVAPKDASGKPDMRRAFSDADRKAVIDGLLNACDGGDGLKDGIVFDPIGLPFRSRTLVCAGREGGRLPVPGAGRGHRQGVRRPEGLEGPAGLPGLPLRHGHHNDAGPPGAARRRHEPVGPAVQRDRDGRGRESRPGRRRPADDPDGDLDAGRTSTRFRDEAGS